MRIAYFDCISGISGNMTLGAMLACGLEEATLLQELSKLNLPNWHLACQSVQRRGIQAVYVEVEEDAHSHEDAHPHHGSSSHHHRGLNDIQELIQTSNLSLRVKEMACAIFTRLATAEAAIHGTTLDQVHFHEVGAVDAIVDIVGSAIGIEALGIERVMASPLPLGHGWVTCAHGEFPVPAPATARLVEGIPIAETTIEAELVTPTGAAIITTLAAQFGAMPTMTVRKVGYGAGSHDLPRPNVLRLFLGDVATVTASEQIIGLETNLDDIPGEILGYLMERLLTAGALDVYYSPIQMKKNRPGVLVRVLCAPANEAACTDLLIRETTTLGVRRILYERTVLSRELRRIDTPLGVVQVKVSHWGAIERVEPEYEDCRALAEQYNLPLLEIYRIVRQAGNSI